MLWENAFFRKLSFCKEEKKTFFTIEENDKQFKAKEEFEIKS